MCLCCVFLSHRYCKRQGAHRFCSLLLAFSLGILWHIVWAKFLLAQRLPDFLEGVDLLSSGYVLDMPSRSGRAQQFRFRIVENQRPFTDRVVLLNYYGDSIIEPDQNWQFLLRLNKPHGYYNPGGSDYEAWLFQRGISAKGYVRSGDDNILLSNDRVIPSLNKIRSAVKARIVTAMNDSPHTGSVLALSLGDRSLIDRCAWGLYGETGTTHLFVISGLHIGLIAGFGYWLLDLLLRLIPASGLVFPRQKFAACAALAFATLYSLLAGFTMPTQRALTMLVVFMLAYLLNRNSPMSFRYFLSMSIVLSLNPLSVQSGGFWFSFVAVAALLISGGARVRAGGDAGKNIRPESWLQLLSEKLVNLIKPQLYVFLALSLPLLLFTSRFSLISPLANIIAIPVLGLLIAPMCLFAMAVLLVSEDMAGPLYISLGFSFGILDSFLQTLQRETPDWWLIDAYSLTSGFYTSGALLVLLGIVPRGVINRRFLIVLYTAIALPLVSPKPSRSSVTGLQIYVLDVGQGLSVLLRSQNHSLLFDTGARLSDSFDLGEVVVAPALRALGVSSLDRLVVSHLDNDHSGGLTAVLSRIDSAEIISNEPASYSVESTACRRGEKWIWDDVEFEFLHPAAPALEDEVSEGKESERAVTEARFPDDKENNKSCVLKASIGEFALLLPGDIEAAVERQLAVSSASNLKSTVLVAAHHGSQTSSSYPFLKRVEPSYVVYSAGYRNSFSHPHASVQSRFREFSSEPWNTAESGMISFQVSNSGNITSISSYRAEKPRYWH